MPSSFQSRLISICLSVNIDLGLLGKTTFRGLFKINLEKIHICPIIKTVYLLECICFLFFYIIIILEEWRRLVLSFEIILLQRTHVFIHLACGSKIPKKAVFICIECSLDAIQGQKKPSRFCISLNKS